MFASQMLDSQIGGNLLEAIENPLYLAVADFVLPKGLFEMGYRPPRYTVGALLTIVILLIGMGVICVTAQTELIQIATAQQNANVRAMPSTSSEVVGSLATGQTAEVLEENSSGQTIENNSLWYRVRLANDAEGWVWSGVVTISDVIPTPTITPYPTLSPNPDYETITVENADQLRLAYSWGQGMLLKVAWSPDGKQIVTATTNGLWVYDADNLEAGARQVYHFPDQNQGRYVGEIGFIGNTTNVYLLISTGISRDGMAFEIINLANGQQGAVVGLTAAVPSGISVGHTSQRVAVSPDGQLIASPDANGVRFLGLVYDSPTETITRIHERGLLDVGGEPQALAFNPGGSRLAVSVGDRSQIYDLADQNLIINVEEVAQRFLFSPDGTSLILMDTSIRLDASTGIVLQRYEHHGYSSASYDALMRPDGTRFAVNYGFGIRFYDTTLSTEISSFPGSNYYTSLAYSPDGRQLAGVGPNAGDLTIWDADTGEIIYRDAQYMARGANLDFTENGAILIESRGKRIDIRHPERLHPNALNFPGLLFWSSDFALRSNRVVVNAEGLLSNFSGNQEQESSYIQVFSQDGTAISDALDYGQVVVSGFAYPMITSQAISPDGQTVVLGRRDGSIWIRDGSTLAPRTTIFQDCCAIYHLVFSDDGHYFVSSGDESAVYIWTVDGQLVQRFAIPQNSNGVGAVINADGSRIAATVDSGVYVWDVPTGSRLGPYVPFRSGFVALSPDGTLLAVYTGYGIITLYDVQNVTPVGEIRTGGGSGNLAFTPDGSLLVTSGINDGIIRFWGVRRNMTFQPTSTSTPTLTPSPTNTPTPTVTPSPTPTASPTNTLTPTATPSLTLTPTPSPVVLFQDNFEVGDLSQWDNRNSIGSIVSDGGNHVLHLENTSDAFVIFPLRGQSWSDYAVEARVRIQQGTAFLNVRENANGQYAAILDAATSSAGLSAGANGNYYDLGGKGVGFLTNAWLRLRVEVSGDQIELYVNGEQIQAATSSYHSEGGISFTLAPHSTIEIDDVRVLRLSSGT